MASSLILSFDIGSIIIKLLITFILAFAFGLERQRSHKPASFGTFIFVAVGSCALGIIAALGMIAGMGESLNLVGAAVTGIGFLGAGALIKTSDKIFGFTTAAAIWIFAIFGLMIGIGAYEVAILMYVGIWLTVLGDRYLELRGIGSYQKRITVTTNKLVNEAEVRRDISKICNKRLRLIGSTIDKKEKASTFVYLMEIAKNDISSIQKDLVKKSWFSSSKIE